jgi:hypothetical protein
MTQKPAKPAGRAKREPAAKAGDASKPAARAKRAAAAASAEPAKPAARAKRQDGSTEPNKPGARAKSATPATAAEPIKPARTKRAPAAKAANPPSLRPRRRLPRKPRRPDRIRVRQRAGARPPTTRSPSARTSSHSSRVGETRSPTGCGQSASSRRRDDCARALGPGVRSTAVMRTRRHTALRCWLSTSGGFARIVSDYYLERSGGDDTEPLHRGRRARAPGRQRRRPRLVYDGRLQVCGCGPTARSQTLRRGCGRAPRGTWGRRAVSSGSRRRQVDERGLRRLLSHPR